MVLATLFLKLSYRLSRTSRRTVGIDGDVSSADRRIAGVARAWRMRHPIEVGHRSVVYRFDPAGAGDEPQGLGALVERVLVDESSSHRFRLEVRFWSPIASLIVVPGAEFKLWMGRIVGRGSVVRLLTEGHVGPRIDG